MVASFIINTAEFVCFGRSIAVLTVETYFSSRKLESLYGD